MEEAIKKQTEIIKKLQENIDFLINENEKMKEDFKAILKNKEKSFKGGIEERIRFIEFVANKYNEEI